MYLNTKLITIYAATSPNCLRTENLFHRYVT